MYDRGLAPDFRWGAATSAYQIEGAIAEDGRKPSIWDTFCTVPGAIDNGDTGEPACDHYHRWAEDIALMQRLGLDSYRFSIAWPRIRPDGTGAVNEAGLDFYDRLVDGLLEAGITPFATLYHWDLPQAQQDRGGWPARETAYAFADMAAIVAARLGDRVHDWFTVNEPLCSAWIGHLDGTMAPGIRDLSLAVPASHHLLLGHGLAAAAVRDTAGAPTRIGAVLNLSPCEPASDDRRDVAAARRADGHTNRWWLDPLFGRGYPEDMIAEYRIEPPVLAGDLDIIAAPMEHIGLNYYFRQVVTDDPDGVEPHARMVSVPDWTLTAMGWEVHADGLEQMLVRLSDEYGANRIYVTENGSRLAGSDRAGRQRRGQGSDRLPRTAPGRMRSGGGGRCTRRRLLRLVAPGQLRMGLRLRQAVRTGPRGLPDPASDDQGERLPLRRHHPRRTDPYREVSSMIDGVSG